MSDIQLFNFNSLEVRVVIIDGQPWWVAADVATVLEYFTTQKLTDLLDSDEKAEYPLTVSSSNGVEQERLVTVINESGLYHAIFKSRKAIAKLFRKWVTSEVLPSIRKHGAYITPEAKPENIMAAMTPEQRIDLVSKGIAVLKELGQVTDWDKQMLADQVRNALGGIESKAHEKTFWTVCERAEELSMKLTSGQLSRVGRLAARAYRERYNTEPLKTTRMVNGSSTHVFGYAKEDIDLVDDALSYETKLD